MPESCPRLRVVYPAGVGRGNAFRCLADIMEGRSTRLRPERMLSDIDREVDRYLLRLAMLDDQADALAQARGGDSA
jgi:hypothetical protein